MWCRQKYRPSVYKSNDFEVGVENEMGFFLPYPTFLTEVHRWRTNHVWPLQRDYVMHEFMDAHHRASARQAFVVKKYINMYFFRKWQIVLLDKLIPNWSPINGGKSWKVFLKKLNFFVTEVTVTFYSGSELLLVLNITLNITFSFNYIIIINLATCTVLC